MEIYRSQLKAKLRSKGESLADLSQEIQKLVRKAYPNVSKEMKDRFSMDAFIDSLNDSDLEWSIHQGHPRTLLEAVQLAHEYEAFKIGRGKRNKQSARVRFQKSDVQNIPNTSPSTETLQSLKEDIIAGVKVLIQKEIRNNQPVEAGPIETELHHPQNYLNTVNVIIVTGMDTGLVNVENSEGIFLIQILGLKLNQN